MKNKEIAEILYKIANFLEIKDVQFKPRAYRKAAQNIESLPEDIEKIYKRGELEKIPGVGKNIAEKIRELLETGSLKYYEKLKEEIPVDIDGLSSVEGMGPKTIKNLYKELGIKNLDELEKALRDGKIRNIKGMGEKTEEKLLKNIEFARGKGKRGLLGFILPEATAIKELLEEKVDKISIAGSIRRMKETIGDVDILAVSSQPVKIMDFFTGMKNVETVIAKGETKSSVRLESGVQVDLRIVEKESFGSALQYFTGSKEHNIEVRKIAVKKGYKLNEYGLFDKQRRIAGATEEEIYRALGIDYIPPELRENRGEVEAAMRGNLPNLIDYKDIKGDLQMHTKWSDGANTIEEMVDEARKIGHEFIAITDHVGTLKIAGGMDENKIREQMKDVEKINEKNDGIHVLYGVEVNIMKDGNLDMDKSILKDVDVVVAGIHSSFRMLEGEMTARLINAIENDVVNIIAHPTGRMIQKREEIKLDLEKMLDAAKENDVVMEINAQPTRLDLSDIHSKKAVERGVKLSIGTDAHNRSNLHYIDLGVAVARRGWAEKKDVINTYDIKKLEKLFEKH
ncbi:MAG: DNA polymerase/3'-5' exonuclease PolX [Candidatus Thermoplasmatota archaeon]|nr:DNA polymerase/3'-5' exonuclease PolX [Candidatus Thermoplasmatota archaeon]